MHLISIDPGTRAAGLAHFMNGRLVEALAVKPKDVDPINAAGELVDAINRMLRGSHSRPRFVLEIPHEQPGRDSKPKVDSLIVLARHVGAIEALLSVQYRWGVVEAVRPSDWKRSIKKPKKKGDSYPIVGRVERLLTDVEVSKIRADKAALWDIFDAIGIGLVALGRAVPGLLNTSEVGE